MGIPTTMPDHVQCSPSELYIRVSQGMLCNKLPKENGSRVVRARHTRGQPISGPRMEIQLDRICQRALDPFWTCQSNRCSRGGTLTPNNVKQCRQDNNPPHESFVESSSRARMSHHN